MSQEPKDGNTTSHLKTYLDYYRSRLNPGYAVLVTGDWGTGKTFQVLRAIPNKEAYYVSLFGLNKPEDVIAAVYAAMYPKQAWVKKQADKVSEVGIEVGGVGSLAVGGITAALVSAFLRQHVDNSNPIIFDDLERCALGVKEIMGIINLYVEHHGSRVIVIAHDEKMEKEFTGAKEKVFGQTIRIAPQIEEAFGSFQSSLPDRLEKDFVARFRNEILGVFRESGTQSLRILKHVVEDLARLVVLLEKRHRQNEHAMGELVRLFVAFDIECRAGALKEVDLINREATTANFSLRRAVKKTEAIEIPAIRIAKDKYSSTKLTSTLLQDNVLREMFIEGRYDGAAIRASLEASAYFIEPQSAPPWRIAIMFDELDDDVVAKAVEEMRAQFEKREVTESGELLHIFALRMMMSSRGILDESIEQVVQGCKSYVDDLLRQGRLPPRETNWDWRRDFDHHSSHGFGYWVEDKYRTEFRSVSNYLRDARGKALEAEFPKRIPDLLKTLQADGQQFFEQVCYNQTGNNQYAAIPILAAIPPDGFVKAWLRSPKSGWYWIREALEKRYQVTPDNDLSVEKSWIEEVAKLLREEADKVTGFPKVRIERTVPKVFDE